MDAGRFERSRIRFWTWIVVPLVLIVLATLPPWLYLRRTERSLTERRRLLEAVPPVEQCLLRYENLLRPLLPSPTHSAEATDELTRRISQAAQQFGFNVRSVKVQKDEAELDGLNAVRISVQGQGALPGLMGWLDAVQRSSGLLRVEAVNVTALSLPPEDVMAGDFTFVVFVRPS